MKRARIFLGFIALICLSGWLWLRKPYSPTDERFGGGFVSVPQQEKDELLAILGPMRSDVVGH